jgi:hypothetical protein
MRFALLAAFVLVAACAPGCTSVAGAQSQWVLDKSTLTYHMSHPMHQVDGTSTAARGKGTCSAGQCSFLIAAPVKSFDSGDSNRDLHMLQVTRGAEFPLVSVRTTIQQPSGGSGLIYADLDVEFAGQKAHYARVAFQQTVSGNSVRITGVVPATCSDFKIDPPSFLAMPIKNEIPVRVDMTWHSQ